MEQTKLAKTKLETITLAQLLQHDFPTREDLIFPWLRQGVGAGADP